MNCLEFEELLPEFLEGVESHEQQTHLRSCSACSDLVSELNTICRQARLLQASDEPSPRVWHAIRRQLRDEGLVRSQAEKGGLTMLPGGAHHRSMRWMLPVAAGLLVTLGVVRYEQRERSTPPMMTQSSLRGAAPLSTGASSSSISGQGLADESVANANEDEQLLNALGAEGSSLRAAYRTDLQDVNGYIRDAEESARKHPNDEVAQQYLMNAYEQRATVYELALDRSQP